MVLLLPLALAFLAPPEPSAAPTPPTLTPDQVVSALENALADAIARAEPSVVAIAREKSENEETTAVRGRDAQPGGGFDRPLPVPNLGDIGGTDFLTLDVGSGVVIGDKGEILTAFHVVRGAAKIHVRAAGKQAFDAQVIAADPRTDLAVIVPKPTPGLSPKLTPIKIGDAALLRRGSFLVALGNPFNAARDGKPSASWGILSNLARQIEPSPEERSRQDLALRHYPTLLQLDAKLNLGMSGGAVINLKGELVGITTGAANASGFDAMAGYAIPMDALGRNVIESLRQGKEYEHGFLGIRLDMQTGTSRVQSADPGSPAADGGLQVGDLITAVGNIPVTDADGLVVAINSISAGDAVVLKLIRADRPTEKTVSLAKRRVPGVIATNRPPSWRGLRVDYSSTLSNTTFPNELMEAIARRGVIVSEVESGSEAEKAGLKKDQLILKVDGKPVPNPREFARAVGGLKGPVRLETDQGTVTLK